MKDKAIKFKLSPKAKLWLVEKGYDKAMGARPMQRAIDQFVKKPIIDEFICHLHCVLWG